MADEVRRGSSRGRPNRAWTRPTGATPSWPSTSTPLTASGPVTRPAMVHPHAEHPGLSADLSLPLGRTGIQVRARKDLAGPRRGAESGESGRRQATHRARQDPPDEGSVRKALVSPGCIRATRTSGGCRSATTTGGTREKPVDGTSADHPHRSSPRCLASARCRTRSGGFGGRRRRATYNRLFECLRT